VTGTGAAGTGATGTGQPPLSLPRIRQPGQAATRAADRITGARAGAAGGIRRGRCIEADASRPMRREPGSGNECCESFLRPASCNAGWAAYNSRLFAPRPGPVGYRSSGMIDPPSIGHSYGFSSTVPVSRYRRSACGSGDCRHSRCEGPPLGQSIFMSVTANRSGRAAGECGERRGSILAWRRSQSTKVLRCITPVFRLGGRTVKEDIR